MIAWITGPGAPEQHADAQQVPQQPVPERADHPIVVAVDEAAARIAALDVVDDQADHCRPEHHREVPDSVQDVGNPRGIPCLARDPRMPMMR
jgi:hypothetical protein